MGFGGERIDLENVIINFDYIIHVHLLHMLTHMWGTLLIWCELDGMGWLSSIQSTFSGSKKAKNKMDKEKNI